MRNFSVTGEVNVTILPWENVPIIHGGDLLWHEHSNLIIEMSVNLTQSDQNVFSLHDGSVWIEAVHRIVVFWLKSIANYPFIVRDSYYFDSWMGRVIWGDYSQIKGKHQSFGHFYIDAGQGLGQKNTNMFRISEQNPRIRTWPFFF